MRRLGVKKRIPLPSVGRSELVQSRRSEQYQSSLYANAETVVSRAVYQINLIHSPTHYSRNMAGRDCQISESRYGSEGQRTGAREVIWCPTLYVATYNVCMQEIGEGKVKTQEMQASPEAVVQLMLNNLLPVEGHKPIVAFANFHGVKTSTTANFKATIIMSQNSQLGDVPNQFSRSTASWLNCTLKEIMFR